MRRVRNALFLERFRRIHLRSPWPTAWGRKRWHANCIHPCKCQLEMRGPCREGFLFLRETCIPAATTTPRTESVEYDISCCSISNSPNAGFRTSACEAR